MVAHKGNAGELTPPFADLDEIRKAARLFIDDNLAEVRVLNASYPAYWQPHTESGYFNDPDTMEDAVDALIGNCDAGSSIYVTLNPVNPDLHARAFNRIRPVGKGDATTNDTQIVRRRFLLIDLDPARPSGISATDAEKEKAKQKGRQILGFLKAAGWPQAVIADSGNGYHMLFSIDLPVDDGGLVQRCLQALAAKFDDEQVKVDTTVHNPARIVKLYGTVANKGDHTPDRPHRRSRLLKVPDPLQLVPSEKLVELAAQVPTVVAPASAAAAAQTRRRSGTFDLQKFIETYLPGAVGPSPWTDKENRPGRKWTLATCPFSEAHTDGAYIVQRSNGAIAAGCQHQSCRAFEWKHLREKFEPGSALAVSDVHNVGLPCVLLPGGKTPITQAAARFGELLAATGLFYRRCGVPVVLRKEHGQMELEPLRPAALPGHLESVANLQVLDRRGGAKPSICNESTARLLLNTRGLVDRLPQVEVIARSPVLVQHGHELVQVVGFDAATGVLAAGDRVQDMALSDAVTLLTMTLSDFQFASDADHSRALAALITPALVQGGLLSGRAPADLSEADESQAGKGFRNKLTAAIYGEKVHVINQQTRGVSSLEEAFADNLVRGRSFISLDNLRGKINSPSIESALTEDIINARVPYSPNIPISPKRLILMMTSNQAEMTRDLANRTSCVRIRKRPPGYVYRSFPEGSVLDHVRANQPRFLAAVFAVVKAWHQAGRPKTNESRHDFREWAQTLDWIVQSLFHAAPLMDGHEDVKVRMTNPSLGWLREVALTVRRAGRLGHALAAHDLLGILRDSGVEIPGIQPDDDIDEESVRAKVLRAIGTKMKQALGNQSDVEFDGFRVERLETTDEAGRPRRLFRFSILTDSGDDDGSPHQNDCSPPPPAAGSTVCGLIAADDSTPMMVSIGGGG